MWYHNPSGLGCCQFLGSVSVVVDSMLNIAPTVCGTSCFIIQYLVSFLVF